MLLHTRGDCVNVFDRVMDRNRVVLPIGQYVYGNDIDMLCQWRMAQPELPHVRIRHGHGRYLFGLGEYPAQSLRRELAAQQHFIANHQQVNDIFELVCQGDAPGQFLPVLYFVTRQPYTQLHAHFQLLDNARHCIEPLGQAVGTNAVGAGFKNS